MLGSSTAPLRLKRNQMKIFTEENDIQDALKINKVSCSSILIDNPDISTEKIKNICSGNACSIASLAPTGFVFSEDVMPLSSILVTDIWNANGDVFTGEELVNNHSTAKFKPINWMHKGSEETENENIGVMLDSKLVFGDIPNVDIFEKSQACLKNCSGKIHIKQDGIIWSQYFPTYAEKIRKGIKNSSLFVSMECFFEDFGYAIREDNNSKIEFIDRTEETAKYTKALSQYGGPGYINIKNKRMEIGRWLKNITFSGQGVVQSPANKNKNKINSIIFAKSVSENMELTNSAVMTSPSTDVNTPEVATPEAEIVNPGEISMLDAPEDLAKKTDLPTTWSPPSDGLIFFTTKEAETQGKIRFGCTSYHLYQPARHGDNAILYSALIADPTDIKKQQSVALFRPCADELELANALSQLGFKNKINVQQLPTGPDGEGGKVTTFDPSPNTTTTPPTKDSGLNRASIKMAFNEKQNKVYKEKGENIMSQPESTLAHVLVNENSELRAEVTTAEKAIELAVAHIEGLNIRLEELESLKEFKASAEQIIEESYLEKIGEERVSELSEITEMEYSQDEKDEFKTMSDDSYANLKNNLTKAANSIRSKAVPSRINAVSDYMKNFKQNNDVAGFVVSSKTPNEVDAVKNLINHAFRRK